MMNHIFETIFLGASAFACSYGLAHPKSVCILERGMLLAGEYTEAWKSPAVSDPRTPAGIEIASALESRGLLLNHHLHLPPISEYIAELAAEHAMQYLLFAEPVSVLYDTERNMWRTDVYTSDGLCSFWSEAVVDTMPKGYDGKGSIRPIGASFRAALYRKKEARGTALPFSGCGNRAELISGALDDEYFLSIPIPADTEIGTARLMLHEVWKNLFPLIPTLSLAAEAGQISYDYLPEQQKRMRGKRYYEIPGGLFPDFIRAWEEGAEWFWER